MFDDLLSELHGYLKPGGLLFVKHSQYRFSDAAISKNYATVLTDESEPVSPRMFDRQSNVLEENQYFDVGFRKLW